MSVGRGSGLIVWGWRGTHCALHHPYPWTVCTLPSFACIKRSRWRLVKLNDWHLWSHGKIGDCKQSTSSPPVLITYLDKAKPWSFNSSLSSWIVKPAWTVTCCLPWSIYNKWTNNNYFKLHVHIWPIRSTCKWSNIFWPACFPDCKLRWINNPVDPFSKVPVVTCTSPKKLSFWFRPHLHSKSRYSNNKNIRKWNSNRID